jgi:hypothetical protein
MHRFAAVATLRYPHGGGGKIAFVFPSMLPLLSSPFADVFLPCILWALGHIAQSSLATSFGAQTSPLQ